MDILACFGTDVSTELLEMDADPRLARRSQKLLAKWQQKPGLSFPEIFDNPSELEAAYRYFSNVRLDFARLLQPHVDKTVGRCRRHQGEILCIQDTSAFVFEGERDGLGFINRNNRGFLGHFALAVSAADGATPIPFGVVAATPWVREELRSSKDVPQHKLRESADCESHRWLSTVETVEARFDGVATPVHIMDREGDIYDGISTMAAKTMRFVLRAMSNRRVESEDQEYSLLFDALDGLPVRYQEAVTVAPRKGSRLPDQRRTYPARDGRVAEICVTATAVTLKRSRNSPQHYPATATVHLVHAFEPKPPPDECPVEWILLTSEPIETEEQIRRVIDFYRQRWLIEEFFMAIKTGCAFEERQLTTYHALTTALAMTIPLAWEMLLLRTQARSGESLPADAVLEPLRLEVLRAASNKSKRYVLPEAATLKDVAYAIAALGGHLKRNGAPGWRTLRRGYERLLTLEQGWILSRKTCDQS